MVNILMSNNAAISIMIFSCRPALIALMWNIPAQIVFHVSNLSSHFISVFTILNVRKLLTPNSLDAVTRNFCINSSDVAYSSLRIFCLLMGNGCYTFTIWFGGFSEVHLSIELVRD